MSSSFPILRAAALLLFAGAVAACGRADAAARGSKDGAATVTASRDTLSDSALISRADRGRLLGSEQAMWVVMMSDYQCPYCKQWHDSSMAKLRREYVETGKVRFAYMHLPLTSIHKHARAEATAALCAGVQGKFWEYSESLFAAQPTVGTMTDVSPLLDRLATDHALDKPAFAHCRQSAAIAKLVNSDLAQASQAGVQSTPSFLIGNFLVQGALPYQDFRKAVDTALIVAKSAANAAAKRSR
jgi:protein-disulfide isomerase